LALTSTSQEPDLAETEDVQITQAIRDLAASLGNRPVLIFNWVRNNVTFLPSYGSIQGSEATFQTRRGNAFDTASLLIALLRAANVRARYVYGTIEVPAEKAMNWVGGVTNADAALNLMGQGGIPNIGIAHAGTIKSIRLEHVWVEAFVDYIPSRGAVHREGDTWLPLDASFKLHAFDPGIDIGQAVPFDSAGYLATATEGAVVDTALGKVQGINSLAISELADSYGRAVDAFLTHNHPDASVEAMFPRKTIIREASSFLPATLPYKAVVVGARYESLPAQLRMGFSLKLYSNPTDAALDEPSVSLLRSLPATGSKRVGVSFVPATASDEAALAAVIGDESLTQIPAYLIRVRPELKVDDEKLGEGPPVTLGTEQIWEFGLVAPWRGTPASHRFTVTAGSELVFGVTGHGVTPSVIRDRLASVDSSTAAENLHQMALLYWAEQAFFADLHARKNGAAFQLLSAFGLFSSPLTVTSSTFGIPRTASYRGREMDVAHMLFSLAAQEPERFRIIQTIGTHGSLLEGAVPEQLFGRPYGQAISAVSLIGTANAQGIPIYVMDQSNAATIAPLLQLRPETRQILLDAVAAGRTVTVPERSPVFAGFQGTGYIIQDSETGTGAYLIDGGLNGMSLPDCACEKVKVPKAQAVRDIIATMIILIMIAALIWGTSGMGTALAPKALAALLVVFGLPALFFPVSAQASSATPPACCITPECGKPDLYRSGRGAGPQGGPDAFLHKIRLNWTNRQSGAFVEDVSYDRPPQVAIPPDTTCDTADVLGISDKITVIPDGKGASHDEVAAKVSPPRYMLPKDVFPPQQLCLIHDRVGSPTHWSLAARTGMTFKEFCDALRAFNGAYLRQ
jgi:hypothetical protein